MLFHFTFPKNKFFYVSFFFVICITAFSQSPLKNGVFISYFPDKKTVSEYGSYKGGKKNGTWITYENTGKTTSIYNWENGNLKTGHGMQYDAAGILKKEMFQNESDSGIVIWYKYDNGKLWKKIISQEKKLNGVRTSFEKETLYDLTSGIVREEGFYFQAQKDSLWKSYDENGILKSIEIYKKGKRNGISQKFYPNKKLAERADFIDGILNGERIMLTETGDTTEFAIYKNNKRNGFCRSIENLKIKDLWEDQRSYKVEGNYFMGLSTGHFFVKYLSGKTAVDEYYENNLLNGPRKLYTENGELVYTANFVQNKINGKEIKYFTDGKTQQETNYVNGTVNGIQTTYFSSGKKSEEATYDKGELKLLLRYHENGKVKSKSVYENGIPVKKEVFDEKGKKINLNYH